MYSASQDRQTCRLASFHTLTDPGLGYLDLKGYVTLTVSLDLEPSTLVHVVTDLMLKDNTKEHLFDDEMNFKTIKVPKNIRKV